MIKKLILTIFLFFWIINNWFTAENCTSTSCINSKNFEISVWNITPGWNSLIQNSTEETVNYTLSTIIEKLMIGLGSLSLLIMTIWAWYMIIYHGQDELLSKWKYIFMSWVIALVVALSSYYMVSLLRYLLYSWN